jgi:hypothetical protein
MSKGFQKYFKSTLRLHWHQRRIENECDYTLFEIRAVFPTVNEVNEVIVYVLVYGQAEPVCVNVYGRAADIFISACCYLFCK